jgi:hypothetical protein
VTEYHFLREGNYRLEVDYMTPEEIEELLEELLSNYRAYHTKVYRGEKSSDEQVTIKKLADIAGETLQSLFGYNPQFSPKQLAEERPGAETTILRELKSMAMGIQTQRPGGRSESTVSYQLKTAEELADRLKIFTQDQEANSQPSVWPFVRIIRYDSTQPIFLTYTNFLTKDIPPFVVPEHWSRLSGPTWSVPIS